MKIVIIPILSVLTLSVFSTNTSAVICLANNVQAPPKQLYLANNCRYFSGSKELRLDRSGALFNYNNRGDYQDQLNGNSFIYCPIIADDLENDNVSAEIKVADLNKQQDVICQMGKSSYTNTGFAAYWGETTRSQSTGEQILKTTSRVSTYAKSMPNSFITCSLPPQDSQDQKASGLVAYSVNSKELTPKGFFTNN